MFYKTYLENHILTADPVSLIRMLYQGAIQEVRTAREHLANRDIPARSAAISKAMAIIAELTCSLDHTAGGEISVNLARLYQYMQDRLLEANVGQIDAPLAEILGLLCTLAEAWQVVGKDPDAEAPAAEAHEEPPVEQPAVWGGRFLEDTTAPSDSNCWTL